MKMDEEMTLEKEIIELRKKVLTFILFLFFGLLFGMGMIISANLESMTEHPAFLLLMFDIGIIFTLMVVNDKLDELTKKYIVIEKIIKRKEK